MPHQRPLFFHFSRHFSVSSPPAKYTLFVRGLMTRENTTAETDPLKFDGSLIFRDPSLISSPLEGKLLSGEIQFPLRSSFCTKTTASNFFFFFLEGQRIISWNWIFVCFFFFFFFRNLRVIVANTLFWIYSPPSFLQILEFSFILS